MSVYLKTFVLLLVRKLKLDGCMMLDEYLFLLQLKYISN